MNHLISLSFVHVFCLGFILTGAGCSPISTEYRQEGFNLTQQSFEIFNQDPELYEEVEIKNIKVYIVGERKYFKWEKAKLYGSPVQGYATSSNEIYVFGKRVGDKIIINQAVLGHELNHLMSFKNPEIANPDQLDKLEFCHFNDFKPIECKK